MDWPILNTARLTCTPIGESDRANYIELLTDHEVMRFLERLTSREKTSDGFNYLLKQMYSDAYQYVFWTLRLSSNQDFLGFMSIVFDHDKSEANLGIVLSSEASTRGYGTEAVALFSPTILSEGWAKTVVAHIRKEHTAANNILTKLSYRLCREALIDSQIFNIWTYAPE